MKKIITLFLLVALVFFGSCYYDIEEQLYTADGNCDTSGVNYSGDVVTIFQSNGCIGCHSGGAPSGNISLEGYNNVRSVAINGKLFGAISHAAGFSAMPQGGNKLSTCNINRIKAWIDAGAPNN